MEDLISLLLKVEIEAKILNAENIWLIDKIKKHEHGEYTLCMYDIYREKLRKSYENEF